MNTISSIIFFALLTLILVVTNGCTKNDTMTDQEGVILALALQRSYQDGGFAVVSPITDVSELGDGNSTKLDHCKKFVLKELQATDVDVLALVETFFEHNKKAVHLSLNSSPQDGYIIDRDGKFDKYFKKDGGGWEKRRAENPKAHGNIRVSVPVHDKKSGYGLLYLGEQVVPLMGMGQIILFKLEKGELKLINRVMLWRS